MKNGTLYIGVTSNLPKRIWEHKNKVVEGFSKKHNLTKLVWYKYYDDITEAIKREKQMKAWKREWKIREINELNPDWRDMYEDLF